MGNRNALGNGNAMGNVNTMWNSNAVGNGNAIGNGNGICNAKYGNGVCNDKVVTLELTIWNRANVYMNDIYIFLTVFVIVIYL